VSPATFRSSIMLCTKTESLIPSRAFFSAGGHPMSNIPTPIPAAARRFIREA
jgi:hypothetical protein